MFIGVHRRKTQGPLHIPVVDKLPETVFFWKASSNIEKDHIAEARNSKPVRPLTVRLPGAAVLTCMSNDIPIDIPLAAHTMITQVPTGGGKIGFITGCPGRRKRSLGSRWPVFLDRRAPLDPSSGRVDGKREVVKACSERKGMAGLLCNCCRMVRIQCPALFFEFMTCRHRRHTIV